jgi:hypothetical protein
MTRWKHARLWTLAFPVLSGSAIATAFGIRLGWKFAVITEVVVLMMVGILYLRSGEDTDTGAILGNRADERQTLIRLKATRLSLVVALCTTIGAFVIAVAVKAAYWPFEVLYFTIVVSYFTGLRVYGADRDEAEPRPPSRRMPGPPLETR